MSYFEGGWLGLHFVSGLTKYQRQQVRAREPGFRVLGLGVGKRSLPVEATSWEEGRLHSSWVFFVAGLDPHCICSHVALT